jgi:GMP synthase (glutamine-hydrolysing)
MSKTALAIRHVSFESLGVLAPLLTEHGYTLRYLDAGIDEITEDEVGAADLLVVLGGPIGVHDGDRYPFLTGEFAAIKARVLAGRRTLGICLGGQLLARALGAEVAASGHTEIGYAPLTLTPEAAGSPLRHLAGVPVLHWHGDEFAIPDGAVRLARTPHCANQAFAAGPHLALQFHLEADCRDIERWLIGYADGLLAAGIEPDTIRRAALAAEPALTWAAAQVIGDWLAQ